MAVAVWIFLGLTIFALDVLVPLGVATGVLYVVLVLLGSWLWSPARVLVSAAVITVMIGAGWYLSPTTALSSPQFAAVNRFLALLAVWVTAALAAQLLRSRQAQEATADAYRQKEERFRAAIAHSPIIVASCDTERRYTWVHNPDRHFDAAKVIGKRDEELAPRQHVSELIDLKVAALEQGKLVHREIGVTVAGERRSYDMTVEPLTGPKGAVIGLVTAAFETTALRRVEAQLREANRHKDDFLGVLSHELRNPLAAIQNGIELVTVTDEKTRRAVAVLRRQSRIMARFVDDLLNISRLDRGKFELKRKVVDVCEVGREVAEAMRGQFERAGLELRLELPARPVYVDADPERLTQVFDNLLRNAARYTKAGRIAVLVDTEADHARIAIRDTGIGIAASERAAVFERYYQADGARHDGSLGLGLTLVKAIVEKHGGAVKAESEGPGRGSEFTFTVPLASSVPEKSSAAASSPASTPRLDSRRILVVDDQRDNADTFAAVLKLLGQRVKTAYSGRAALEAAREQRPEVAFLDLSMPEMDGHEVARRLRQEFPPDELTLIALTGFASDRSGTKDSEFAHHLLKPITADDVVQLLESLSAGA